MNVYYKTLVNVSLHKIIRISVKYKKKILTCSTSTWAFWEGSKGQTMQKKTEMLDLLLDNSSSAWNLARF